MQILTWGWESAFSLAPWVMLRGTPVPESLLRTLDTGYSECGPWTGSLSLTWELVRKAESQAPSQTP